ncbi:MAG: hypothetical protein JRG94_14305 [Deltaproteobacteria bacterium]|nr:hypothetical protein [Deltaproteobacteria bacterium]
MASRARANSCKRCEPGKFQSVYEAVGGEYHDYTTIEFARLLSKQIGGFEAPAAYRED